MEKFGVDQEKPKTATTTNPADPILCPVCGTEVVKQGNVLLCPEHGSEPFEHGR